jgi:very-short-patch-repair endonuclease
MGGYENANAEIVKYYSQLAANTFSSEFFDDARCDGLDFNGADKVCCGFFGGSALDFDSVSPIEMRYIVDLKYRLLVMDQGFLPFVECYGGIYINNIRPSHLMRGIGENYRGRFGAIELYNIYTFEDKTLYYMTICPQYKVDKYTIDFMYFIFAKEDNQEECKMIGKFAVELDGHDFHEKTKEQVRKAKERDRFLLLKGIETMRFSGSEVFNDVLIVHKGVFEMVEKITKGSV